MATLRTAPDPPGGTTACAAGRVVAAGDRLLALDGLRGAAMLVVLLTHGLTVPLWTATLPFDITARTLAITGWVGVDVFFVLSGFLITGILLDTQGQPRWWPNFIVRRALRVFPLYYGALAFLFVVLPRVVHWSAPQFLTLQANQRWYWTYTVNFLYAFTRGEGAPLYTGHFWSLSIEEQFYLIWPLVVWACDPRHLPRVAVLTMLGGFAFRLALVLHDPGNARAAFFLTPGRLDGLMLGATLAVVARQPGGLAYLASWAPRVLGGSVFALGVLAVLRGTLDPKDPVVAVLVFPIVALAAGALLVLLLVEPPTSGLVRVMTRRWLRNWGTYSYAIYIIHLPLLGALEWKTQFPRSGLALLGGSRVPGALLLTAIVAVASYAVGWLSYHLYEKRFLSLKRFFAPSDSAPSAAPRPMLVATPLAPPA